MSLLFALPICIGCPYPPPPPPPPPPPDCEGYVQSPYWGGAELHSRNLSELSFILDDCVADYVFFGPDGVPEVYNNRINFLTVDTRHTKVSKNSTKTARLYVANTVSYAWYSMNRWEIASQGNGIVHSWSNQYFIYNSFVYETYERLSIGWPFGTKRNVWVGASTAELHCNCGGTLPREIDAWLVRHNYTNAYFQPILSRQMSTGPLLGGNPVYGNSTDNHTFGGGVNTNGQAKATNIQIGGAWSTWTYNNPIATAEITN